MIEEKDYLRSVIGIEPVKNQVVFHIKNYEATGVWRPLLITGSKGSGKNHLTTAIFRNIKESNTDKIRKFVTINCSILETLEDFFSIVDEHFDNEISILFDECEQLKRDSPVALALLTILAPHLDNKNTFKYNGQDYVFSFKKTAFIFCTNEPHKMNPALVDRLQVISLPSYKLTDLAKIIAINLPQYKIDDKTLEKIASVTRSNPRSAVMTAQNIDGYLKRYDKRFLNDLDWKNICKELSILPMGLNHKELEILQILKSNPRSSLTKVSNMVGDSSEAVRQFSESFLLKNNLMQITAGRGRELTNIGQKYLKKLKELELTNTH